MSNYKWKEIGECGVDAGILMIADPCYWIKGLDEEGRDAWDAFMDRQVKDKTDFKFEPQVNFDMGHAGKGVVAHTAHGDGVYPVYALYDKGHSAKAMVVVTSTLSDQEVDELSALLKRGIDG